ncbi:MAG: hypothetical protein PWQ39_1011 [Thermacetogenium sp.]|nr:hypothetical protein [Thermacetogenium sp.]
MEPGEDVEIRFIGIRPGEKLREELFTDREKMSATRNSRILIARNGDGEGAEREVASLADKLDGGRIEEFRREALALRAAER